ncbi:hypothetical protein RHGRI_025997 [Rhododendron griersonianum]|uniref:F-box associated beta-propeller type 1 domain-containing protein n=1 Tax=Rhododendron griersonianum TaxID=479676 RepID=A0AAV6IR25_9ERIC|nr:hypothetical protein RHGRI_025997 [Rhododendron griersonianum]
MNTHPSHNVTGLKTCSLRSVLESQQWESAVDLDYPFNDLDQSVVVVGSCNGLMCVAATLTGTIYLFNPSTRKSKRLPDSGIKRPRDSRDLYGFGFDESNDDYKVVLISHGGGGVSAKRNVMVYTLRTDSWRQIGGFPGGVPCNVLGNFLNGSLLWLVCVDNSGPGYSYVIVSLDLEKETYGEVLQPNYGKAHPDLELCVLERCLGVLCTSPKNHIDVWIMKEYGKIDSWTKLFTIQDVARPYFQTLCISKKGELLILFGQHLSIYSSKNGTCRNLVIHNANNCEQMCTYVESLVSPDADNVVET